MSMYDKSYCGTFCDQKDCERNLRFHKPQERYYSTAMFDENNPDQKHKACRWKMKKGN